MDARRRAQGIDLAWWLILVLAALGTFVFLSFLVQHFFIWTEARSLMLYRYPGDLAQFLLFPEPDYGAGRLTRVGALALTGRYCGVDPVCVNNVSNVLIAGAVVLLLAHTRQLSRSTVLALTVAGLWLLLPPLLGNAMWKSAWNDVLAFIFIMLAGGLWWRVFGRAGLSRPVLVTFAAINVPLLALAFNSKELTFYLVGILPLLAVARGAAARMVSRNLLLSAPALLYAGWYIAWALTHIAPAYLEQVTSSDIVRTLPRLALQAIGLHRDFMFLVQSGDRFEQLFVAAWLAFVLFAIALVVTAAVAVGRAGLEPLVATVRARDWRRLTDRAGLALYLGATFAAVWILGARSQGAAAYYMVIAAWAGLTLTLLLIRWIAAQLPGTRAIGVGLTALLALPIVLVFASNLTAESTYRRLSAASEAMDRAGGILRSALAGREVTAVRWRMTDLDPSAFFVTRGDPVTRQPGGDIWPWLLADFSARPEVTPLEAGGPADLRAALGDFSAPGETLLVMSPSYDILLLAHEGEVLYEAGSG
jgi:hypothetical protein